MIDFPSQHPGLHEKHLMDWRGGFSAAGFDTELLPSVPGDAPGKKKRC